MAVMGLSPIYQKPKTSIPNPQHEIHKYMLKDMVIDLQSHVWCSYITYIPIRNVFLCLVAIMDWATQKVLSWKVLNTMEADFCIDAFQEALARFGKPETFNMSAKRHWSERRREAGQSV